MTRNGIGTNMPAALDQNYDGIIVGAGHHGLVLGSLSRRSAGSTSCWWTAGCNTAARWSPRRRPRRASITTCIRSIISTSARRPGSRTSSLADRVEYITPRYEFGQPHLDGSALIFGRDLEETLANVARFSKKDAQTFRDWNRKAEEITAQDLPAGAVLRSAAAGRARGAVVQERDRPRFPRR